MFFFTIQFIYVILNKKDFKIKEESIDILNENGVFIGEVSQEVKFIKKDYGIVLLL